MTAASLRARLERLARAMPVSESSPIVRAALLHFLATDEIPDIRDDVLDVVLGQAQVALFGFDELTDPLTHECVERACALGTSRFYLLEDVALPEDFARQLSRVNRLLAERRGPIDPSALAYL